MFINCNITIVYVLGPLAYKKDPFFNFQTPDYLAFYWVFWEGYILNIMKPALYVYFYFVNIYTIEIKKSLI